jgi:hypothetical protein
LTLFVGVFFLVCGKIRRYEKAVQSRKDKHHVLNHPVNKNIELKKWSPATTIKKRPVPRGCSGGVTEKPYE